MDDSARNAFVRHTFESAGIPLLTADPAALARHALPQASKRFLAEVGLPDGRPFNFDFRLVRRLPTMSDVMHEQGLTAYLRPEYRPYPCVAERYGVVLMLDGRFDAAVRLIDLAGEDEPLFVNSRTELLGASLAEYVSLRVTPDPPLADAERQRRLTERLREIDPAAVEREYAWWNSVLEEIGYGLA